MVQFVGILNLTPDSFSDGGQFIDPDSAIAHTDQLFKDGAALVDVGAESTRPGAEPLSDEQEWERLEPVLRILLPKYMGKICLDSYHPETIRRAWQIGPVIINDVTGFNNPDMIDLAAELRPTVIISNLPKMEIQKAHKLKPISTVNQVKTDLLTKAEVLQSRGLRADQIILDPGIGFGKPPELSWELLKFGDQVPDYKVMIGYSRKSFLGKQRKEPETNLAAAKIAISCGAEYLRVHDVAAHIQSL